MLALAVVWLVLAVGPPPHEGRQLFGIWRTRDFAIGCLLIWSALLAYASARSRRVAVGWLVSTFAGAFSWALLEIVGLLGLLSYPDVLGITKGPGIGAVRAPHVDLRGEAQQDIADLWKLPFEAVPFRYKTDRFGLRNELDRTEADVYCVGDSFVVAGLVPFENTLTSRLEKRLDRPVMNLAISGIGLQEEHDLIQSLDVPLRDRLVLQFVTESNDLVNSDSYRHEKPGPTAYERTFLFNFVVWLQRITQPVPTEAWRHVGHIGKEPYLFLWDEFSFLDYEDEIDPVLASLRAMRDTVESAGGRYALILIPSKLRVLGPLCDWPEDSDLRDYEAHLGPLPDLLQDWCRQEGIDLLDLTDDLVRAAESGKISYFKADTHWNEVGHEVVTDALLEWPPIKELLPR